MKALIALVVAVAAAVLVAWAIGPKVQPPPRPPPPPVTPKPPMIVTPTHTPTGSTERAIPPGVAAQGDVRAAPWAPGIRLEKTDLNGRWEQHRALIEDQTTKDVRAYAIGDLLPHGSLLVGISTGTVDVLVADREIVRLRDDGTLSSLEDFTAATAVRGPRIAKGLDPEYREAVEEAVEALTADDPELVQRAIDVLVDQGEPAIELLIPHVDDLYPVAAREYFVPSGAERTITPEVQGDLVIVILESITAQNFGDPEVASPGERRAIGDRWRRWWGD